MKNPVLVEFRSVGPVSQDVRLLVDGIDLTPFCRSVKFSAKAGALNKAAIELAHPGLDVMLLADVTVHVVAYPGYVLIEEPLPEGGTRWRCERESGKEPAV